MKTNDVLLMLAVSVAAYFIAAALLPKRAAASNWTAPGSQQSTMLADQCGGWLPCLQSLTQ
jgi:hypothetical protein